MTTQEKRFFRRELINYWLQYQHGNSSSVTALIHIIRNEEITRYGLTLNIFSQYVTYL